MQGACDRNRATTQQQSATMTIWDGYKTVVERFISDNRSTTHVLWTRRVGDEG